MNTSKKGLLFVAIFSFAGLISWSTLAFALNVPTHQAINEAIAKNGMNGFSLDSYLKQQLGFANGIKQEFTSGVTKQVWDWIGIGGKYEDEAPGINIPYYRSRNHFHNPLKPIDQAGFSGLISGMSSILWSQADPSTQGSGNNFSWHDVRMYYYNALKASDQDTRSTNFANTFRGLGQLMHLVQDMSVPEHTRNHSHTFGEYEGWVTDTQNSPNLQRKAIFDTALSNPIFYRMSVLTQLNSAFPEAPVAIANLFDTYQYGGPSPNPAITTKYLITENTPAGIVKSDIIGLAEYTNANFVSSGTIFSSGFPYPSKATSVQKVDLNIPDPMNPAGTITRQYYYKIADGDTNYLLAGVGYLRFYADENNIPMGPDKIISPMDDNVYAAYAQRLLPRAVGYSVSLFNYFFRGTLDVSWPVTGVYSIADGSQTPYTDEHGNRHQQFTKIRAEILNITPNEEIGAGTLTAVARYKIIPNYAPDLSNYPPDGEAMAARPYSYSISQPAIVSGLSSSTYTDKTFDFTSSPIPAGITDLTLQVVFKGTIGNEADNAIAVGMKDIMEPTHLTFWNLRDMYSLQYPGPGYTLYTYPTLQSMVHTDTTLLNMLDDTKNGSLNDEDYLKPFTDTFTISFWTPSAMVPSVTVAVPPGAYIRLIVLVNQSTNYFEMKWNNSVSSDSSTNQFTGVLNQAEQTGEYGTLTPVVPFRQGYGPDGQTLMPIFQHNYMGVVGCKPDAGKNCPYSSSQANPVSLTPIPFMSDFN